MKRTRDRPHLWAQEALKTYSPGGKRNKSKSRSKSRLKRTTSRARSRRTGNDLEWTDRGYRVKPNTWGKFMKAISSRSASKRKKSRRRKY